VTTKAKADDETTTGTAAQAGTAAQTRPATADEALPVCGAPHFLPVLAAQVTCTEPPDDPDLPPGRPGHEHRRQDGDALYTWR
jgi:hypothetical protein